MEIVFLRHAATDLAGTFCGHLDPPVNAAGRQQIARAVRSDWVAGLTGVHSSDLQRARTTAEALAACTGLGVTQDAAWREIGFGAWEGLKWAQIEALDAAYARRWAEDFPVLPAPGGELYSRFCERVLLAVAGLRAHAAGPFAVVTHAGVLRVVLQEICGVEAPLAWQLTQEYCSGFRLHPDDRFDELHVTVREETEGVPL